MSGVILDEAVLKWIAGVMTATIASAAWMIRRQIERIDNAVERIGSLENQMVTKDDLTETEARITQAITTQHVHIAERLGDVRAAADKAHDRLDKLRDQP